MSGSNCCFLTCIQISQEAGRVVLNFHKFNNFPQFVVIHTVKGFSVVNEAVDVFLKFSCFFDDSADIGNLISGSSAFSKSSSYICKFSVQILLKPNLKDFKRYLARMWDECNCAVVWTFLGIALLWDWNESWPFPVLWLLLSFPHFLILQKGFFLAKDFRRASKNWVETYCLMGTKFQFGMMKKFWRWILVKFLCKPSGDKDRWVWSAPLYSRINGDLEWIWFSSNYPVSGRAFGQPQLSEVILP